MAEEAPPPPPPPHGANPKTTKSGLPDGNYDIFIIPPHSSGSGFLYLPSLKVQRNSFLVGIACGVSACVVWTAVLLPALQKWAFVLADSSSFGVALLVCVVGVAAWAFGKTQGERAHTTGSPPRPEGTDGSFRDHSQENTSSQQQHTGSTGHSPRPQPEWTPSGSPPPQSPRQEPQPEPTSHHQHNTSWTSPPPHHPQHEPESTSYHPRHTNWTSPPPRAPESESASHCQHESSRTSPPPTPTPKEPTPQSTPRKATQQTPSPGPALWQKMMDDEKKRRDEAKKREEAQKRAEELRKLREEAQRKKEASERQARAAAEKLRWEQKHQRDKEALELAARERLANEKIEKEKQRLEKEKQAQEIEKRLATKKLELEQAARLRLAAEEAAKKKPTASSEGTPAYVRPTVRSYASTETSQDRERGRPSTLASSTASYTEYTESTYTPSISTARTSLSPPKAGPYVNRDPDNVTLIGVYLYDSKISKPIIQPVSQLVCHEGGVGDGLILRIISEGLFIDDDVRKVPQREWDVKAWGIKSIEIGELRPYRVLRATMRAEEGKKYVFIMPFDQGVKLDLGIARLKKGNLVRSLGMNHIKAPETKRVLGELGYSL